ncbi:MAG: hypothetical protein K2G58_06335, partial [Alistipes sp.]|nr:hypothetical protein [Alistipes sp.]
YLFYLLNRKVVINTLIFTKVAIIIGKSKQKATNSGPKRQKSGKIAEFPEFLRNFVPDYEKFEHPALRPAVGGRRMHFVHSEKRSGRHSA